MGGTSAPGADAPAPGSQAAKAAVRKRRALRRRYYESDDSSDDSDGSEDAGGGSSDLDDEAHSQQPRCAYATRAVNSELLAAPMLTGPCDLLMQIRDGAALGCPPV